VKNDYGTEKEARALNGLEEPLKKSFQPHYKPGVDSASNRNGHQGYFSG
jgi:hypothetical protein